MHKVLFDTNVWVDVVLARPAFIEESLGALVACGEENIDIHSYSPGELIDELGYEPLDF